MYMTRNTIGAVLRDIDNSGDIPLSNARVRSLQMDRPVIVGNSIGLSLYKKLNPNAKPGSISGSAYLGGNETPMRLEEGTPPAVRTPGPDELRAAARKTLKACTLCRVDPDLKDLAR